MTEIAHMATVQEAEKMLEPGDEDNLLSPVPSDLLLLARPPALLKVPQFPQVALLAEEHMFKTQSCVGYVRFQT